MSEPSAPEDWEAVVGGALIEHAQGSMSITSAIRQIRRAALPNESPVGWDEYVKLRRAFEDSIVDCCKGGSSPDYFPTRTALDAFIRRCIGVRGEPSGRPYGWIAEWQNPAGEWHPCPTSIDDFARLNVEEWIVEQVDEGIAPLDRFRVSRLYIGRAPVTPDERSAMQDDIGLIIPPHLPAVPQ
jgi:hypothetical protein